jgi:hypothetical protein
VRPPQLLKSVRTTARFHLGTVAFGSLLIAVCQLLRIILEYVDQQTKSLQDNNLLAKLVLRCVKCCMWCLEKFLKFITVRPPRAARGVQAGGLACPCLPVCQPCDLAALSAAQAG